MRRLPALAAYAALTLAALAMALPLAWVVLCAMKTNAEIFASPWSLPAEWDWRNFVEAVTVGKLHRYALNSVVVTCITVLSLLFVASLAAFAFARLDFPGRDLLFPVFLVGLVVPIQGVLVPLFVMLREAGILYTRAALILPYLAWGLPLGIYVLRAYFLTIPSDLEDAARIDGCSPFALYWRIMLPIARPALAAVTVFSALDAWNELLLAQLFIADDALRTLPVGILHFSGHHRSDYALVFAGLSLCAVPVVLLFVCLQRWFVSGLTSGALKE